MIVKDLGIKAHNLYSTCENILHWAITQMEGMKAKVENINVAALIIRNLLQNALKFTHTQGSVVFKAENDSFGKGPKRLIIQDNGIGISSETMSQLFQIDKNTNRAGTAKENGTGLGLILTKELVELNGGRIDVESEVGKGTKFSMVFYGSTIANRQS